MHNISSPMNTSYQIVLAAFGTSTASAAIYTQLRAQFEEHFSQKIPIGFTSRVGTPTLSTVLESIIPHQKLEVVITPLFMVPGRVVKDDVCKVGEQYTSRFASLKVARTLLPDERVGRVIREELFPDFNSVKERQTGILFVGHGTPDEQSAQLYKDVALRLSSCLPSSVKVAFGNVEFSAPYCREVIGELIMSDIKTLVIQPFMIVDGVHIKEDIRDAFEGNHDNNELAYHLLTTYGERCRERLKEIEIVYRPGLGAYRGIFEIFADHTAQALFAGEVLSP